MRRGENRKNARLKKKAQLDNSRAFIQDSAAGSTAFLLFYLAFVSCFRFLAPLSSYLRSLTYLSPLFASSGTLTALLSYFIPALVSKSLAVFSFLSMFGPTPSYLAFTTLKTFKKTLLDTLLRCSTNFVEFICLFLPLNLLPNKTDYKRTFDITFINSCPFAGNYAWKEVDLSFAEYGCLVVVKLNRLQ